MLIRTRIPVAQMAVTMVAMSARTDRISRMATSGWLGGWCVDSRGLMFDVRGRRRGEATKGTCKHSLQAVHLDGIVRSIYHFFAKLLFTVVEI